MGKVFAFVNQKGGVGKTTSAINIGAYLAEAGKRVLLVDFDPQANLSSGLGTRQAKPDVYEFIAALAGALDVIRGTDVPGLSLIPAGIELSGAAVELIGEVRRDYFLRDALSPLVDDYDFVLIDCPPSLGVLTLNALAAANGVLIPMQCEYFAMEGLALLTETIRRVQKTLNQELHIEGIFFTMYDQRTRLAQEVVKQVGTYFHSSLYSTIIPRNVRLSEAPSHSLPISLYDRDCVGARAYKNLAEELLRRTVEGEEGALREVGGGLLGKAAQKAGQKKAAEKAAGTPPPQGDL
jgi:chromosome partitioning protein